MNRYLLEYEIKRHGYTISTFCAALGMSRSTFSKKVNGKSEFTRAEIEAIVKLLEIENPTPIFFDDKVS